MLIHSLVSLRLDYCNGILAGITDHRIKKLQRVQNVAAQILTRTPKLTHITPVLCQLHWLPIKARILFKILIITYKAINNIAPSYINSLVTLYQVRSLRSEDQLLLQVLKSKLKTFGDRAFPVFAPKE